MMPTEVLLDNQTTHFYIAVWKSNKEQPVSAMNEGSGDVDISCETGTFFPFIFKG